MESIPNAMNYGIPKKFNYGSINEIKVIRMIRQRLNTLLLFIEPFNYNLIL
jgi:hypothetical protein